MEESPRHHSTKSRLKLGKHHRSSSSSSKEKVDRASSGDKAPRSSRHLRSATSDRDTRESPRDELCPSSPTATGSSSSSSSSSRSSSFSSGSGSSSSSSSSRSKRLQWRDMEAMPTGAAKSTTAIEHLHSSLADSDDSYSSDEETMFRTANLLAARHSPTSTSPMSATATTTAAATATSVTPIPLAAAVATSATANSPNSLRKGSPYVVALLLDVGHGVTCLRLAILIDMRLSMCVSCVRRRVPLLAIPSPNPRCVRQLSTALPRASNQLSLTHTHTTAIDHRINRLGYPKPRRRSVPRTTTCIRIARADKPSRREASASARSATSPCRRRARSTTRGRPSPHRREAASCRLVVRTSPSCARHVLRRRRRRPAPPRRPHRPRPLRPRSPIGC